MQERRIVDAQLVDQNMDKTQEESSVGAGANGNPFVRHTGGVAAERIYRHELDLLAVAPQLKGAVHGIVVDHGPILPAH